MLSITIFILAIGAILAAGITTLARPDTWKSKAIKRPDRRHQRLNRDRDHTDHATPPSRILLSDNGSAPTSIRVRAIAWVSRVAMRPSSLAPSASRRVWFSLLVHRECAKG